jgi:hypothetical protein
MPVEPDQPDKDGRIDIFAPNNLGVSAEDVMFMFKLSFDEFLREGHTGRLVASGHRRSDGKWDQIQVTEANLREWVAHKNLPKAIKRKIKQAGGAAAIDEWRRLLCNRIKFDFVNNSLTHPRHVYL